MSAHFSATKSLAAKNGNASERSVSPPPTYQRVDPQISSAPVRPARPDRSQTLEDIVALYEDSDDIMPMPQPFVRTHARKPALSLAVSPATSKVCMAAGQPESAGIISPPNSYFRSLCRDPLNTVYRSEHSSRYVPHIVVTPPQYREVDPHAVSAPRRAAKPFKLPVSRSPMDQWACQYTYRACAFLAARKAPNMLRAPSAALVAALQPSALEWSDAAEPLLSLLGEGDLPSTFVLESQTPCTVPHIVLTMPAADDGWAAYDNLAPPQHSFGGQLLALDWAPRAPVYQSVSVADEEWCSADAGCVEIDGMFTFLDDDLDELPSPTRTDSPALPTPPPYSEAAWGAAPLSAKVGKDQGDAVTLSPTSGPGLPLFFAQGDASPFSNDFPSAVEFDMGFSPISPVSRTPFAQDWMQSVMVSF